MAIVRIRATAGRWTRAGDCEDWSAACVTFLTLDAAERAARLQMNRSWSARPL